MVPGNVPILSNFPGTNKKYKWDFFIFKYEGKNIFHKGSVWIVGAGPGDPGLLTMHAVKAIRLADTIFYDALINNEILHLSKPHAKLIYVGKRANKHSINQL